MIIKDITPEPQYQLEVTLTELIILERALHYTINNDSKSSNDFTQRASALEQTIEEVTLNMPPEKRNVPRT